MAIYQCVVPQGTVQPELRPHIADRLARIHCEATGADPAFVQVVFIEVPPGAAFNGGQPSNMSNIAGYIRAGRPRQVRQQILARIDSAWTQLTGLPSEQLKITLMDIPAAWIMHAGRMMPEPGQDEEWLARAESGAVPPPQGTQGGQAL